MYQGVLNERVTEHYQQVKMEIFFFFCVSFNNILV